jgi:outer membrane lipoprotein carrier protein
MENTLITRRSILAATLALPAISLWSGRASAAMTSLELADRVQAFYDKSKTFKAAFTQRYVVKAYQKTIDSKGQVIFEKPGKMSWRYTTNGNRVVSDGKIIRVYEKENKQMFEQPLNASQYPAALSFLVGGAKLRASFVFDEPPLDGKQMNFEGGWVLKGKPTNATPTFEQILLYIDGGTYQVRRVILLDAQNNRNRFDFENPEVNTKIPPSEFQFSPPPGTHVVKP